MAKTTTATKATAAPAPSSTLINLAAQMRLAADEMERLQPIIAEERIRDQVNELSKKFEGFRATIQQALLVPKDEFESLQPLWTEAWQLAKDLLVELAGAVVGPAEAKRQGRETDAVHRQRVLVKVLGGKAGLESAKRLAHEAKAQWRNAQAQRPALKRHVADPEANEALKAWGTLSEEVFLEGFSALNKALVQRAADLLGLEMKRVTLPKKKELFKRASRFVINTQL